VDSVRMTRLPLCARVFVVTTIAAGAVMLALYLPNTRFAQPFLFFVLLLLSSATAALKVHLPLTTSGSTMSVSYAVDFAPLLLIGPDATMLVAATRAFRQRSLNTKEAETPHQNARSVPPLCV